MLCIIGEWKQKQEVLGRAYNAYVLSQVSVDTIMPQRTAV
jgi:hypothetical protein